MSIGEQFDGMSKLSRQCRGSKKTTIKDDDFSMKRDRTFKVRRKIKGFIDALKRKLAQQRQKT